MAYPVVFVLEVLTLLCVGLLLNAFKTGLNSFPGPTAAKFTDLYRALLVYRGRLSRGILDMHREYGSIVRIGPNALSISDRHLIDDIYGLKTNFPKSDYIKPSQTLYQGKVVPALVSTQDKVYHNKMKKSVAQAYAVTSLKGYEPFVEDAVHMFLRRISEEFITPGKTCPMHNWLQWYAYDVIGMITISRPMGFLRRGEDVDNMLGEFQVETNYRAFAAQMPWVEWVLRKNPIAKNLRKPTSKIMVRARQMLDTRLEQKKTTTDDDDSQRDFITRFHEAKDKHPDVLDDSNMLGFVGSNLQAGSDTTAIVLRSIVYYTYRNKDILSKVQQEIDNCSVPHPIPHRYAFSPENMPYTDAVIREALRVHPPFALLLEREVPAEGLNLRDGRHIPARTKVGMTGYAVHRDKEVFGDDADEFNPERWLQKSGESDEDFAERFKAMKNLDLTFSLGTRACLGRHVAELQIYKLVPAILGLLDIQMADPDKEWTVTERFFGAQSDMDMVVQWRKGKSLDDYPCPGVVGDS